MALVATTQTLKSLQLGLRQSFVLKDQCNHIVKVLKVLQTDIKSNGSWYSEGNKFSFKLSVFLKRFLRFVRMHLKVTDRFPKGLGELRKARSLCNVNRLRMDLNTFASELQVLLLCSGAFTRLNDSLQPLLSGQQMASVYRKDSETVNQLFTEVLEGLKTELPEKTKLTNLANKFLGSLPSTPSFESFDSPVLREFSYALEEALLGMTVHDPTKFSDLEFKTDKHFRKGRFGTIYEGKLGGPSPVCIQKISSEQLQTLSSDGRVKLFQTLRSFKSNTSPNLLAVLGVTLHEGALFVSLESVKFSLADFLHGDNPRTFTSSEMVYIFLAVSSALSAIHKEAVIHGDVRPDNIFFGRRGQEGFCKLAMFSYELNLDELHWSTWNEEALVYQAPEVLGSKQFSTASDMYSLGVCMWEITQNDEKPFSDVDRNSTDLISEIKEGRTPDFKGVDSEPQWLVHEVSKAWSLEPSERPSAEEMKEVLDLVVADMGVRENEFALSIGATVKSKQITNGAPASPVRNIPPVPKPVEMANSKSPVRKLPPVPGPGPVASPARTNGSRPLPPIVDEEPDLPPRLPDRSFAGGSAHKTIDKVAMEKGVSNPTNIGEANGFEDADFVGANGLTEGQVREELIKFYTQNDPDMLKELNDLVKWCMVNGLEEFDRLLVEKFGKGLPMYEGVELEDEPEQPTSKKGGLAGIFTRRRNGSPETRARPIPQVPGGGDEYGFDSNGPPPMPPRGGKPPGL